MALYLMKIGLYYKLGAIFVSTAVIVIAIAYYSIKGSVRR